MIAIEHRSDVPLMERLVLPENEEVCYDLWSLRKEREGGFLDVSSVFFRFSMVSIFFFSRGFSILFGFLEGFGWFFLVFSEGFGGFSTFFRVF